MMDSNVYTYFQKRFNFNKKTNFTDSKKVYELLNWPVPAWDRENRFLSENPPERRNPNFINLSNMPEMGENTVNTERVNMDTRRMFHYEGGWPSDMDITEEKLRHNWVKKRIEKDANGVDVFTDSCRRMCKNVKEIIKMNNQIDMFEEYFEGEVPDHNIEKLSVKTSMLFKDPEKDHKRQINKISWHPDGPHKLAGAYCIMRFQKQPDNLSCKSYIWDIKSPNSPCYTIEPPSPITSLSYNHKNTDEIAFGCYNGRVGFIDVRGPRLEPGNISEVEHSHHEPVVDVIWLSSKLNNEFVTCSTDGQVCWWDNRKFGMPSKKLYISEVDSKAEEGSYPNIVGGTCLEFVPDHGPKYLVGTEKGSIMLATKKPGKNPEINYNVSYGLGIGRHLGPIYSIKRNPFNLKYFLSIGDWSVNIWEEETKTPIMKTRYHPAYLTDGCWAPQRPGVFFVTRKDGWLDIWDFYYRQNEVAFSHKVSNFSLTTIKVNTVTGHSQIGTTHTDIGKYAAIGDSNGTITLLELCNSLYEPQPQEKDTLTEIFEREKKREEHLKQQRLQTDARNKKADKERKDLQKQAEMAAKIDVNKEMSKIQDTFEANLKKAADDLYKVYLNDSDMIATLAERLAHGTEKKATRDIAKAQEVYKTSANIPSDYEKKAGELSTGVANYFASAKQTFVTAYTTVSNDTVIASAKRMGETGSGVSKLIEWKCSTQNPSDKEIASFEQEIRWDSSIKDKTPTQLEELYYIFQDVAGRFIGIDKSGNIATMDYDKSKGTVTGQKYIGTCYAPEKYGAAMSKTGQHLFYIDHDDGSKIWKHNVTSGQRVDFIFQDAGEISSFLLVNEETLFVVFSNSKACRYDMNKKSYERTVQFSRNVRHMSTYLNFITVLGNVVSNPNESYESHEIVIMDQELREVGRYQLDDRDTVIWIDMKISISKTPIIIVGTQKELYGLRLNRRGELERLSTRFDISQLKGDGLHSFKIHRNIVFISDSEGFLTIPIKGDIDDQDKMIDLANHLEEAQDQVREKEDKQISNKLDDQEKEARRIAQEEELRLKEREEADRKRLELVKNNLDVSGHFANFYDPRICYRKLTGPRFDKFCITTKDIYLITEEDKLLQIVKHNSQEAKGTDEIIYESKDRPVGHISHFEIKPSQDVAFFMSGSRLMRAEKGKKLEEIMDVKFNIFKCDVFFIGQDMNEDHFNVFNYITEQKTTLKLDFVPYSLYKTNRGVAATAKDGRLSLVFNDGNKREAHMNTDTEARIVHMTEEFIYIAATLKTDPGAIEPALLVYDYDLNLQGTNRFMLHETNQFTVTTVAMAQSTEEKAQYLLIGHEGSNLPILLKRLTDTKWAQPRLRTHKGLMISNFGDVRVQGEHLFIGNGRKIYQFEITESKVTSTSKIEIATPKEVQLVLSEMYKDQVSLIKRTQIETKDFGPDVLLSKIIANPQNPDLIYIAKNTKSNETSVVRYNFQSSTDFEVVKEVNKPDRQSYFVDIVVTNNNKIIGIDNLGYLYTEADNDKMVISDLRTFPKESQFNYIRNRELVYQEDRKYLYLITDESDSIVKVNMDDPKHFYGLEDVLSGTVLIKTYNRDCIVGIKKLDNAQGKSEYYIYKIEGAIVHLDLVPLNLPMGYHVESLKVSQNKHFLVVCNKRLEKDSKSGHSADMLFLLYNLKLEREFISGDVPVGNKYQPSNVIEILCSLQALPIILVSRGPTIYIFAIETENKLKQLDAITFSEADGPDSKLKNNLSDY